MEDFGDLAICSEMACNSSLAGDVLGKGELLLENWHDLSVALKCTRVDETQWELRDPLGVMLSRSI